MKERKEAKPKVHVYRKQLNIDTLITERPADMPFSVYRMLIAEQKKHLKWYKSNKIK